MRPASLVGGGREDDVGNEMAVPCAHAYNFRIIKELHTRGGRFFAYSGPICARAYNFVHALTTFGL